MRPAAVTIGNFDGVHAGHRQLLRTVVRLAHENHWTPAAVTFHPHPTTIVAPHRAPRLLMTPEERAAQLRSEGIERVEIVPFTAEFARKTPEEFVRDILIDRLGARAVCVGGNFRFGYRQSGDTAALRALGEQFGFETHTLGGVSVRGRLASSSEIRKLIEDGRVSLACRLLERPFALRGEVVAGRGVGSRQTVPTLNLQTSAEILPKTGVYITETEDLNERRRWPSITNVGHRPTFDAGALSIETFLLAPLEGPPPTGISVAFHRRVRDERKFASPEDLKARILRDVALAQTWFRRRARFARPAVSRL
ncbi:MAG TPA: bifunctional riboflavin kinase/FAD synthetase [Solibacterales bacterium]|nr:bifunctional riboflavin kinase/FAD synthetase [Bryobacterales bacterium]